MREPDGKTEYRIRRAKSGKEDDFDIEITDEDVRAYDLLGSADRTAHSENEEEILFAQIGESAAAPEEKAGEPPAEKTGGERRAGRGKWKRLALVLLLLLVLIPAGRHLAGIRACRQGAAEYAAYKKELLSGLEAQAEDGAIPDPEIDWDGLASHGQNLAGILYLPSLDLVVPYSAGEEADYALTHTFSGTESPVGSIFCSEDTDAAFSGLNAVLLGAAPRDGSLFGGLKKLFSKDELLQENPCVFVFTRQWRRRYQVFAGFSAMNTDPVLRSFSTEEKYQYYLTLAESRSTLEGMADISSYTLQEEPFLTLAAGSGKPRTYSRILCCILTGEETNSSGAAALGKEND